MTYQRIPVRRRRSQLSGLGLTAADYSVAADYIEQNINSPGQVAVAARAYRVTINELVAIVGTRWPTYANRTAVIKYFSDAGIPIGYDDIPDPASLYQQAPQPTQTTSWAPTSSTSTTSSTAYQPIASQPWPSSSTSSTSSTSSGMTQAQIDAAIRQAADAATAAALAAGATQTQASAAGTQAAQQVASMPSEMYSPPPPAPVMYAAGDGAMTSVSGDTGQAISLTHGDAGGASYSNGVVDTVAGGFKSLPAWAQLAAVAALALLVFK
jgi:hypothetical protein